MATRFGDDVQFAAGVNFSEPPVLPDSSITRATQIAAGINLGHEKIQHRTVYQKDFVSGTDVAAGSWLIGRVYRDSTVLEITATPLVVPTLDKTVSVDIQRSTAGSTFSSIVTAAVSISSTETARVPIDVAFPSTSSALVEGDLLQLVLAVAGSSGDNVKGLLVDVVTSQDGV
jgi:hypothetical protein